MPFVEQTCTRCRTPLTDPASRDRGVGPSCKGQTAYLYAVHLPLDILAARAALSQISVENLDESMRAAFLEVSDDILSERNRRDWREVVKQIEWICSFPQVEALREMFCNIVRALGYIGLASVWEGKAAKGKCHVWFKEGRLYMQGPRTKDGIYAFKQIPGRKPHPPGTVHKDWVWSAPVSEVEHFRMVILSHWPNFDGLTEAVTAVAEYRQQLIQQMEEEKAQGEKNPDATELVDVVDLAEETPPAAIVTVVSPRMLWVSNPHYSKEFYNDIMQLPPKSRGWNGRKKVWEVDPKYKDQVIEMCRNHYGACEVVES